MTYKQWYEYGVVTEQFKTPLNFGNKYYDFLLKSVMNLAGNADLLANFIVEKRLDLTHIMCLLDGLIGNGMQVLMIESFINDFNLIDDTRPSYVADIAKWNYFIIESLSWKYKFDDLFGGYELPQSRIVSFNNWFQAITVNIKGEKLGNITVNDFIKSIGNLFVSLDKDDCETIRKNAESDYKAREYPENFYIELAQCANIEELDMGNIQTERAKNIGKTVSGIQIEIGHSINKSGKAPTFDLGFYDNLRYSHVLGKYTDEEIARAIKFDCPVILVVGKDGEVLNKVLYNVGITAINAKNMVGELLNNYPDAIIVVNNLYYGKKEFWDSVIKLNLYLEGVGAKAQQLYELNKKNVDLLQLGIHSRWWKI